MVDSKWPLCYYPLNSKQSIGSSFYFSLLLRQINSISIFINLNALSITMIHQSSSYTDNEMCDSIPPPTWFKSKQANESNPICGTYLYYRFYSMPLVPRLSSIGLLSVPVVVAPNEPEGHAKGNKMWPSVYSSSPNPYPLSLSTYRFDIQCIYGGIYKYYSLLLLNNTAIK